MFYTVSGWHSNIWWNTRLNVCLFNTLISWLCQGLWPSHKFCHLNALTENDHSRWYSTGWTCSPCACARRNILLFILASMLTGWGRQLRFCSCSVCVSTDAAASCHLEIRSLACFKGGEKKNVLKRPVDSHIDMKLALRYSFNVCICRICLRHEENMLREVFCPFSFSFFLIINLTLHIILPIVNKKYTSVQENVSV